MNIQVANENGEIFLDKKHAGKEVIVENAGEGIVYITLLEKTSINNVEQKL